MKDIIDNFLNSLSRPFHSEADLQHELAIFLRDKLNAKIRLEKPMGKDQHKGNIDLFIDYDAKKIGIELKYKTQILSRKTQEECFNLKQHSAHPLGRYDFYKDISRLENWINKKEINHGFAIFLTNDGNYLKHHNEFNLGSAKIEKNNYDWLNYKKSSHGTNRKDGIIFGYNYSIQWQKCNNLNEELKNTKGNNVFQFLILEIPSKA